MHYAYALAALQTSMAHNYGSASRPIFSRLLFEL